MKRIKEVDILKGILIILVVICHVNATQLPRFINFIYLFHMPAFFILSGLTYKDISVKDFFRF